MRAVVWSCLFLAFLGASRQTDSDVTVNTTTGCLRGTVVHTNNGQVRAFLGIPFAEPPVGPNRFKRSKQKQPWEGVLNATTPPPMCPQQLLHFNDYYQVTNTDPKSEDCLFLNVFTPLELKSSLKPVVVYIHGGFFSYGGISMKVHDASELSARGDLVAITIAYRLGPFGFLNMGTEDAPGNMGLHDQLLALRWIKDNAEAFGGDPDQVTIIGQSAGSFAVGVHLVSPASKGLFRRAVMQSASPFTSTLMNSRDQANYRARLLVETLGCRSREKEDLSTSATMKCMRSKPVEDILNASSTFTTEGLDSFFPVVGDEIIPVLPGLALRTGNLNAHDLLAGVSEAEGDGLVHFVAKMFRDGEDVDIDKKAMIFFAKGIMITLLDIDSKEIIDYYFGGAHVQDGVTAIHAAADLLGDSQLGCPTVGFAKRALDSNARVFLYRFSHQPSKIGWPKWVRPTHTDEIAFALGSIFKLENDVSQQDAEGAENFMQIISTFSRTGVPQLRDNTTWPKFDRKQQYVDISKDGNIVKTHFLQSACKLWEKTRPYE